MHIRLCVLMATMFLSGECLTIPSALASRTTPKVPFPVHKYTVIVIIYLTTAHHNTRI